MTIDAAIRAVAHSGTVAAAASAAWHADGAALEAAGINNNDRRAMLIGQCAHESAGFLHRFENLNYSADALFRVFRSKFADRAECEAFARQPERIANRAYANRMGNGSEASGDGFRYRGRGYLQLTGKDNYRIFGDRLGIDLVGDPDRAAEPSICWRIAADYCASRRRSGRTLLEWADLGDTTMVTKGINGGTHGLADRIARTARALAALSNEVPVAEQQRLLLAAGFNPGPIDGLMGPKTRAATDAASAATGVAPPALWAHLAEIA